MKLTINNIPEGLSGYQIDITVADSTIAKITDVIFPPEFGLSLHIPDPVSGAEVQISAVDLQNIIIAGDKDVLLASINIEGLKRGTTKVNASVIKLDDDRGFPIILNQIAGTVVVI